MKIAIWTLVCLVCLCDAFGQSSGQQLADFLPRDTNVVVGVHVPRLLTSQAGQNERLDAFLQMQMGEGRTTVSPTGEAVVMAANIDLNTHRPAWQMFLWRNSQAISTQDLAEKIQGTIESIGDRDAVVKREYVIVKLLPDAWGVLSPANRQVTGRWLRDSQTRSQPMEIVQKLRAVNQGNAALAIVIDVRDFFSAQQLSPKLSKSEMIVVEARMGGEEAAPILASVQWATIVVSADDKFHGEITLDFERSTERLKPIAMKLLQATMANRGLVFDDLSQWTATAVDRRLVARGPISVRGLRKLLTLLDPPRPSLTNPAPAAVASAGGQDAAAAPAAGTTATRSAAYFKEVTKLLDDLQGLRNADAQSGVAFITRYIKRIESVSIVDVDPALLDWSSMVVVSLSEAVKALRESTIAGRQGAVQASATYDPLNVQVNYGDDYNNDGYWYDGDNHDDNEQRAKEMRRMRNKAAAERVRAKISAGNTGREAALQVLSNLDQETAAVRRAMVQKYQIDF